MNLSATAMNANRIPGQFDLLLTFLDKLESGVKNPDQRVLLLTYRKTCQKWTDPLTVPFTMAEMQLSLTELESRLVCKICGAQDHPTKNCIQRHKRPKTITPRAYEAEAKPAPKKTYRNMKCYKCGGNHRLADFYRAFKEEIKRIYAERKEQFQKTPFQLPSLPLYE